MGNSGDMYQVATSKPSIEKTKLQSYWPESRLKLFCLKSFMVPRLAAFW